MGARMAHDLRIGIDVSDGQIADPGTRDRAIEAVDVRRIGYQRIEAIGRVVVPMSQLATIVESDRRE
jgi:hypothetical protein